MLDDRIIYTSPFVFPPSDGLPLLCDFGEARRLPPEGSGQVLNEDIMPNPYRAPEVILKMNWDWRVDIWNVAVLVRPSNLSLRVIYSWRDLLKRDM